MIINIYSVGAATMFVNRFFNFFPFFWAGALCSFSAAFFVFFPAAAGAGCVAADLGLFQSYLFYSQLALWCLGGGTLSLSHCKLADLIVARCTYIPNAPCPGAGFEVHLEDNIRNPVLNAIEHLLEHS